MDNYEDKSDDEINLAVQHVRQGKQLYGPAIDYCNNPSYSWPIITENKISIEYTGDDIWGAIGSDGGMFSCSNCADKNPLRACMIVYLKMMEAT